MKNPFTDHPSKVNETYFQHMKCAFTFFYTLLGLSLAALVHAIFPFLFVTTASRGVKKLNDCMKDRKPINGTEYHTYFPSNDFELPTHEEIEKSKKKVKEI